MKILISTRLIVCMAMLLLNCYVKGQTSTASQNVLLSDERPKDAKVAISDAVRLGRIDLVWTAMHNKDFGVRMFCLESLQGFDKAQQARFLGQLLLNDDLLERADEAHIGTPAGQIRLQAALEKQAYLVLGQTPPKFHGMLTRFEAQTLAGQLSQIK